VLRVRSVALIAFSCLVAVLLCLAMFRSASAAPSGGSTRTASSSDSHSASLGLGYWLVGTDGGIFSEGGAQFDGSTGGMSLNKPIVGMAATPNGMGYWLVAADGGIFNYGNATFEGSAGSVPLNQPVVGMAATPDGKGYWLVASDGGIFNYGDAAFYGSTGGMSLNKPIVGMAATPDGKGYWLVASDGGIFSYGDAKFYGSTGGSPINKPVVGMAASPDGKGYWLVAADGGIFNYGDAAFYGSTGGSPINKPIVGMAASPDGKGYWLVASDGGIFNYGDAVFYGSTGGMPINKPMVGMAVSGISGAASQLAFSTQPAGASGGSAFATQPVVTVEDAAGNLVPTDHSTVTIAIAPGTPSSGGPGTLSSCTSTGEKNGVFSFTGCTIDTAGTGYKLVATDGTLASASSAPFTVSTGPANHIAFTAEPSNAIGGSAFVNQPTVTIEDAGGNTVTTDTHAITLGVASGPGALSGCTATTAAGVANFSGCTINTAGTYTLSATDAADSLSATSAAFDVGTGVPSQLAFTTEPGNANGGTAFGTQPTITIQDAGGNTVTTDTHVITLAKALGTGTLSGCTSTTTAGVAAFSGCTINTAGAYTLTAIDASDAVTGTSNSFTVDTGPAHQLAFTAEPSATATGGTAFAAQPAVTVEDAGGNTVTTDASTVILATSAGPGALSGCVPSDTSGVTTFTGCSIDTDGTYTLAASDGSLAGATSSSIVVSTGAAHQLAFTVEPAGATGGTAFGTQPTVTIQDAGGNTVSTGASSSAPIALSLTTGSGALTGCSSPTTTAGVAAFTGCSINTADTGDILTATDATNILTTTSTPFNVTVGAAHQLAFTTEPSPTATGGTAFAAQPAVTVQDAGGNTVTTDSSTVTLATSAGPGTLSGCVPSDTAGVTTFTGCSIDTDGTYTLAASDGPLAGATSSSIVVSTGAASQLAFTAQPSPTATGGTPFAAQPAVTVEDAGGNTVTTDASTVTLATTAGPGTVSGCVPTETTGVVTFSGCSIDTDGTYTLSASDGGLTGGPSTPITVSTGAPTQVAFTTEPGDAFEGEAFGTQPVVTIEDAGGNTVAGDDSSITMAMGTGAGTLSTCTSTTIGGVAQFSGCSIDTSGEHAIIANDGTDALSNESSLFQVNPT
jgi:trimeric autotransporter adhesin